MNANVVTLNWQRFPSLIEAREATGRCSCVYVQADGEGRPLRVGLATHGLHKRYWGGSEWALEAAMHGSGNLWFVAQVDESLCSIVESTLIWEWRGTLPYNLMEQLVEPRETVTLRHEGKVPRLPKSE